MKKSVFAVRIGILLFACLLFCCLFAAGCGPKKPGRSRQRTDYEIPDFSGEGKEAIFYGGVSNYVLVIGEDPLPAVKTAAEELRKYFRKMTGFEMDVVSDREAPAERELVLGRTNRESEELAEARTGLGDEGYLIRWEGSRLFVTGGDEETATYGRGTLYGAYGLLRLMGCGFYAKDTEVVPKVSEIILKKEEIKEVPAFEYRDVFWTCAYDAELSAKLGLNGGAMSGTDGRVIPPELGGTVSYAGPKFVHTFPFLVPAEEYFAEHPEYFSLINGKRVKERFRTQLCLSNEDVYRIVLEKVKIWLRENPEARIVSVSQDDGLVTETYCTCKDCRKVNGEEQSQAGTLIRFVNRLAEDLEEEFPGILVDTLAYQFSLDPPRKTAPRDNVIVRYCTGSCCSHSVASCPETEGIRSALKSWSRICSRIYVWDYTTDFAQYLCPFFNFASFQENLRFYRDRGVKGVFFQGNYQSGENGEFGELRSYLLARLLWDPDADPAALTTEFLNAYYGEAGPLIGEYLQTMTDLFLASGKHLNLTSECGSIYRLVVKTANLNRFEEIWKQAKETVSGDSVLLSHVERSELCYRFYKKELRFLEFSAKTKDEETAKLWADCLRLGVLRYSEGAMIG